MGIRTLACYLIGRREAILQFAASRWTPVLGFLFVMSAAFAREYDGADWLHEPWHLLAPLGASLLSSFVLFSMSYPYSRPKTGNYFGAYWVFLGLFWMTAPLAWLYAIPYERFLTAEDAMRANLSTLGLVAAWRVVLMVRVLVVHMNYPALAAFFLVMAFADGLALLLALAFVPVGIMSAMGGIRLSGPDQVLTGTAFGLGQLGCFSLPIWIIGAIVTRFQEWPAAVPSTNPGRVAPGLALWMLALASLAIWLVILPVTQPEQQLRHQVEKDFQEGKISQALAEMSAHAPEDFPPNWQPPPRPLNHWSLESPQLFDVFEEIGKNPPALWVREIYLQKLRDWLWCGYFGGENQTRMIQLLKRLPERTDLLTAKENRARDRDFFKLLSKEFGIELKDQNDD